MSPEALCAKKILKTLCHPIGQRDRLEMSNKAEKREKKKLCHFTMVVLHDRRHLSSDPVSGPHTAQDG